MKHQHKYILTLKTQNKAKKRKLCQYEQEIGNYTTSINDKDKLIQNDDKMKHIQKL